MLTDRQTDSGVRSMHRRIAFTLAEVLIVLGIIGVVAEMTIPTLMSSVKDNAYRSAFKKDFSVLSQAYTMILQDNGVSNAIGLWPGTGYTGSEELKNSFKQYLSVTKDCKGTAQFGGSGTGVSAEGCWHKGGDWKTLQNASSSSQDQAGLILSDGTLILISHDSDCSFDMTPYNGNYNRCGWINVDINGFKKPNQIGKDIVNINILKDKLVPEGAMPVDASKVCSPTGDGWDCSVGYLSE